MLDPKYRNTSARAYTPHPLALMGSSGKDCQRHNSTNAPSLASIFQFRVHAVGGVETGRSRLKLNGVNPHNCVHSLFAS